MKEEIGNLAGKIWQLLNEREEASVTQLSKILEEKSPIVNQALGWLAREDKVTYRTSGARTFVSLAESERRII